MRKKMAAEKAFVVRPRLAMILGVETDEVFKIEGYPAFEYKISESGNMLYRHPDSSEGWGKIWKFSLEPFNHPEMIIHITQEDENGL